MLLYDSLWALYFYLIYCSILNIRLTSDKHIFKCLSSTASKVNLEDLYIFCQRNFTRETRRTFLHAVYLITFELKYNLHPI